MLATALTTAGGTAAFERVWSRPTPSASTSGRLELPVGAPLGSLRVWTPPPRAVAANDAPAPTGGCDFDEPKDSAFLPLREWLLAPKVRATVSVPRTVGSAIPLLIHFHGGESVRALLAPSGAMVLVGVDAGPGSTRYKAVPKGAIELIRAEAMSALRAAHPKAELGHTYVSAWSAGTGALGGILRREAAAIRGLVLLDGLHANYVGPKDTSLDTASLEPFLAFARDASQRADAPGLVLTYSDVETRGYASTREVATHLASELGLPPGRRQTRGRVTFEHQPGDTADDHCDHLRLLPEALVRLGAGAPSER